MDLTNYLKAGYPAIHVVTQEPLRAISALRADDWESLSWDCQSSALSALIALKG